jgi:hypothetical protein
MWPPPGASLSSHPSPLPTTHHPLPKHPHTVTRHTPHTHTHLSPTQGFNGDAAELLHGLGALPALEAVCDALSAPAVGLVANRAYKVEMANVYRVHALALTAQVG